MAREAVSPRSSANQIAALLDSPEIDQLVTQLAATRWTARPGYPIRAMVGMALAKSLYTLPTWTRTVALVSEHAALRVAIGCPDVASVPSIHACYRFAAELRAFKPLLDACIDRVTAALHEQIPDLGATVAIDASDLPAYANGQRYLYKGGPERKTYADPDATWGHRSAVSTRAAGSFHSYKLHQVVCAETDLPLAWRPVWPSWARCLRARSLPFVSIGHRAEGRTVVSAPSRRSRTTAVTVASWPCNSRKYRG